MKNKWTTVLACFFLGGLPAQADQAFRIHRYNDFKVLPTGALLTINNGVIG